MGNIVEAGGFGDTRVEFEGDPEETKFKTLRQEDGFVY